MPVESHHPDYIKRERDWALISDCMEGQRTIKEKGDLYLPKPNPEDISLQNQSRYKAYKKRAVFHNVTARTVHNMVGQCFSVDPVHTLPPQMEPWLEDLDGSGVSAIQQAKRALGYVVAMSRAFLWVDYPKVGSVVSQADAEDGGIRPRVILCDPQKVINWRVIREGVKSKLSMVVIREPYIMKDDGFIAVFVEQFRVLRLMPDPADFNAPNVDTHNSETTNAATNVTPQKLTYWMEVYRPFEGGMKPVERIQPLDGNGQPLDHIPGTFIGAESNGCVIVEKPLMLDIANLNIAHYRNSADYEEAVYMLGQPTPYITGLTDSWVQTHMKGGVFLGSRECIPLPVGGSAGMLQASINTLPKEAMDQKEELMQALGAKLVERLEVAQTATETGINEASETSILASCCKNVSSAYGYALREAANFGNIQVADPDKDILFELNTEFAVARMTPQEAQQTLALYQADAITFEELRDKLKSGGYAYLTDEDAKDQLEQAANDSFMKAQADLQSQTNEQMRLAQVKQGGKPTPPEPVIPPTAK